MSQEILLGFGLKVKNNGKDGYCRISKTILPSGKTVSIQYDSKDEKALAIRTFGQLNAIAKQQIYEFTDLTFTPGTGGSGGGDGIEVQDLDLQLLAEKVPSTMKLTTDIVQNIVGTSRNGLLKGVELPPPQLTYDEYELLLSENMIVGENGKFLPVIANNPLTNFSGRIGQLVEYREYLIKFGNQVQTNLVFNASDDSSKVSLKQIKYPNGTYGLEFTNESGQIYDLSNQVPSGTIIDSIVIKIQNGEIQILRIADTVSNSRFSYPSDYVLDIKVWGNLYDPIAMSNNQYLQLGWAASGLGNRPVLLSGYFSLAIGEFTITVDETRPTSLYVFQDIEPTETFVLTPLRQALVFGCMYFMGQLNVVVFDDISGQPKFQTIIEATLPLEAVTFRKVDSRTLEILNKGVSIGTYHHPSDLSEFVQTANVPQAFVIREAAFDLSKAYVSFAYRIPEHIKDGVYYRMLSNANLFGKELRVNDFIRFFNEKSDIILIRVPEDPVIPELPVSTDFYRGKYDSLPEVHEKVTNPKAGDYVLLRDYGKNIFHFYSPEEYIWKPLLTETNFKGLYNYLPYISNSKEGDFIVLSTNFTDVTLAIYNPYLSQYVELRPKSADLVPEGQTNKYYTDQKVIALFENLILTDFSQDRGFKAYLDSYIQNVFMSDAMPIMSTVSIHAKAKVESQAFKLDGITEITSQIAYESVTDRLITPTAATPAGAYDIFEFDRIPFNLFNGFWYIDFDIHDFTERDAEIHVGVMVDNASIPVQYAENTFYIRLNSFIESQQIRQLFYGFLAGSNSMGASGLNMRFSIGYRKGYIFMIDQNGLWWNFGHVNLPLEQHNNVKFFIRKIHGTGIAVGNVNAVFGEVFKLPNIT